LRLTRKGNIPLLALTVVTASENSENNPLETSTTGNDDAHHREDDAPSVTRQRQGPRDREAVVIQEIPVRVLHESKVEGLHEPRCPRPDVHIILPTLLQLKSISERFTKLATDTSHRETTSTQAPTSLPMLELSANMHGSLKLAIATDALRISTVWTGLVNPPLDPAQLSQDEIDQLPSERMRALGGEYGGEEGWAKVRIDGRDWGRVLSVGRLSPKVVACECIPIHIYIRAETTC
jgi:HUS1 checkpoint protein